MFVKGAGTKRQLSPDGELCFRSFPAPIWPRAVAPYAEWLAHTLWSATPSSERKRPPATRLTQRHNREAQGGAAIPSIAPAPSIRASAKFAGQLSALTGSIVARVPLFFRLNRFGKLQIRRHGGSPYRRGEGDGTKALRSQSARHHNEPSPYRRTLSPAITNVLTLIINSTILELQS